jgi:Electron transfer DM13
VGSCGLITPMAETHIPPSPPSSSRAERAAAMRSLPTRLVGRVTTVEWIIGGVVAAVMLVLVVLEPDILEAPVENPRTILFTVGGTIAAAVALVVMLWFNVSAILRILVLSVPFAIVSWWLISPFFLDDVVEEGFSTSIATQLDEGEESTTPDPTVGSPGAASPDPAGSEDSVEADPAEEPPAEPAVPVLLGAGQFVGLAGHSGTGDAGIFRNPDGSYVLRFENFDIENGPDLEVYLVPGADRTTLDPGSIHLGDLKGNVGNQTYDLPSGTALVPGPYTALVWCEAFTVEFVGATLVIS